MLRHAALIQKERAYREKKREENKAASAAKAPAKAPAQKKKDDDETSGSYEYVTETEDDLEAGKAKQAQQAASDKKKERLNAAKPKVAPGSVKPASTVAGSSSDGKRRHRLWPASGRLRQLACVKCLTFEFACDPQPRRGPWLVTAIAGHSASNTAKALAFWRRRGFCSLRPQRRLTWNGDARCPGPDEKRCAAWCGSVDVMNHARSCQ